MADLADDIRALEEALAAYARAPHGTWEWQVTARNWVAAAASPDRIQRVLAELKQLREQAARYHWLCAHLTQIHVETTQPAGSPEDAPMRVTLIQAWPGLPRTDAGSVDAAVGEAMKEGA